MLLVKRGPAIMDPTTPFEIPPSDVLNQRAAEFLDSIANSQILEFGCIVCAREITETASCLFHVREIPHLGQLSPIAAHTAHIFTEGLLLHKRSLRGFPGEEYGSICTDCKSALDMGNRPHLSLANNLWIGDVPLILKSLTLAERVLISLYPHTTYHIGFRRDTDNAAFPWHARIRSRSIHPEAVTSPLPTKLLPMTPSVLCKSFVFDLPIDFCFRPEDFGFLRVRKFVLREALLWLQDHNSEYDQVRSPGMLWDDLPEDGIPTWLVNSCLVIRSKDHDPRYCEWHSAISYKNTS